MTATAIILNILFILCLTIPAGTHSLGLLKADNKSSQKWFIPLLFGVFQGVFAMFGNALGKLFAHLITYIAEYMVFVMMLVVAVKMFVESMRILKGKILYTVSNDTELTLLALMSAINTLLISLMGPYFMPFGKGWFMLAIIVVGFLWSFFAIRVPFDPKMIKKVSFIEFSAAVFMVIIAILYLFTDLMK